MAASALRGLNDRGAMARDKPPLPLRGLAAGMLCSFLPGLIPGGIGVQVSYLGWMLPLLACAWVALRGFRKVTLPYGIWLPWTLYALVYLLGAEEQNALQRTIMLLTPLVVGMGFSCLPLTPSLVVLSHRWLDRFYWIFLASAGMATGLLSAGQLSETSGFAAGSITASMLACWYAVRYAFGWRNALIWWGLTAVIPVLANTRTGMVAVGMTLPLTLAPYPLVRRVLIVGAVVFAGLLAFQTEHVQRKMFFSGHGTLEEAFEGVMATYSTDFEGTGNFATSGRKTMTIYLQYGVKQAYWFGHGANTTEPICVMITGVTHPHNDWMRLQYEYGTAGLLVFLAAMVVQALHAWRAASGLRRQRHPGALYLYAGATSFLPMGLFMFSDNVILYAAWFGNLQFAMLGLGYSAWQAQRRANAGSMAATAPLPPRDDARRFAHEPDSTP